MKSRIISGIIACCYLVVAYILNGPLMTLRMAGFLIFPLACIWFSNAMGEYTGLGFGWGQAITEKSPGCAVAFAGWLLLLLPVFAGIVVLIN